MNKDYMARMSAAELDEYAKLLGFVVTPAKTAEDKMKLIEQKRERTASIRVLGIDFEIPIKRVRDKRLADIFAKRSRSDAETEEAMRLLLGEQMEELVSACTDEDEVVDLDAMALAFVKITTSEELKNF